MKTTRWTLALRVVALSTIALSGAGWSGGAAAQRPEPVDSVAEQGPGVSAAGAFARSVALPGWGQAYVGAPGRGAVYFALEAGAAWMTYKTWRQLGEARNQQVWMRETGAIPDIQKLDLLSVREEQFEDWLTLSIFIVLFSGIDAFVTAQLADFDEHIGVRPAGERGLELEARLPVGRR